MTNNGQQAYAFIVCLVCQHQFCLFRIAHQIDGNLPFALFSYPTDYDYVAHRACPAGIGKILTEGAQEAGAFVLASDRGEAVRKWKDTGI